jgi:peptide/nickel transport system substrate-binding protein
MEQSREEPRTAPARRVAQAVGLLLVVVGAARCGKPDGLHRPQTEGAILRVGISNAPSQTPERGIQQFVGNISNEGLLRVDQAGRPEPLLAQAWRRSPDGMRLTIQLRRNVTFHDGSPVDAQTVAQILRTNMPKTLGASFEDVDSISVGNENDVSFQFRHPSSFVAESLVDVTIQKPGAVGSGTGPFMLTTPYSPTTNSAGMTANAKYYLGRPALSGIAITAYPNLRAAWAELLRDRLDMLYEVGSEALDSLRGASNASLYAFDRPYQYLVFLNPRAPRLQSREVRQALNQAIDRASLIRDGLDGHGTPSMGPISSHHWAFQEKGSTFTYAPQRAAATIAQASAASHAPAAAVRMTLTCLTPAIAPFEHLALVVKQQLAAVGVDLVIEEVAPDRLGQTLASHEFEAVLVDALSGWSVYRAFRWWHSKSPQNLTGFSSPAVDAALDHVRHAASDDDYREGVGAFQQAIADDPPAIFLAWGDRSRAVSRRFDVQAEPGRDVLSTLRLWRPTADSPAGHN